MYYEKKLVARLNSIRTDENSSILDEVIHYIEFAHLYRSSDTDDLYEEDEDDFNEIDVDDKSFDSEDDFQDEYSGFSEDEGGGEYKRKVVGGYWSGPGDNRRDGYSEFDYDE